MPRISANKLGEFLTTANPIRRRAIITDQKNPPEVVVPLYRGAADPIADFLNGGGENVDTLYAAIDRLRSNESGTEWAVRDRKNTAEALEHFLELAGELPFDGIEYIRGEQNPPKLQLNGVDVSVRPDYVLHYERRGKKYIGALKFHFVKNEESSLGQEGAEFVATLLYRWLHENAPDERRPSHTHCFSIDVFRESIVTAPASYLRRQAQIEEACAEIAARWNSL